ncbi:MAG: hypothetical protein AB7O96_14280 [Pseudobdellovibrionaceae bacterium]
MAKKKIRKKIESSLSDIEIESLVDLLEGYQGRENAMLITSRYNRPVKVILPRGELTTAILSMVAVGAYNVMWNHQMETRPSESKVLKKPSSRGEENFLAAIVILHSAIKVRESNRIRKPMPRDTISFYIQLCQDLLESKIPLALPFRKPNDLKLESVERRLRYIVRNVNVAKSVRDVLIVAPKQVEAMKSIYNYYLTQKQGSKKPTKK